MATAGVPSAPGTRAPAGGGPGSSPVVLSGAGPERGHRLSHRRFQFPVRQVRHLRSGADEPGPRTEGGLQFSNNRSQPAPNPVALRCTTDTLADGVGDPWRVGGVAGRPRYRDRSAAHPSVRTTKRDEGGAIADPPDQTQIKPRAGGGPSAAGRG